MVLYHVPEDSRFVKVGRARSHTFRFGSVDLDGFDIPMVPNRIKKGVCKPEHQDVLNGLFGEVVVVSINAQLVEIGREFPVEVHGRGIIGAEGFFDNDRGFRAEAPGDQLFGG